MQYIRLNLLFVWGKQLSTVGEQMIARKEEIHNIHITYTMAESVEVNKAANLRVINYLWLNKIIKDHADLYIDPFCKKNK